MEKNASFYIRKILTAGISQALLAKELGVSQASISRVLTGSVKDPGSSLLMKLQCLAEQKGIK